MSLIQGLELKLREKEERMMKERLEQERDTALNEELERYEKEKYFKIGK